MTQHYIDGKTGKGPFQSRDDRFRPNILLITMDMVPPEFHDGTQTLNIPHQISLAQEGLTFTGAFAASPLCGPSRASLLTGRYPYITGNSERSHDGHKTELRSEDIIWPEYLRAAGYHTRHIGKSHVGTEHFMRAFTENSSPWDRWSPPWFCEDSYIRFLRNRELERFSFKKEIRGMSWEGERNGNSYGGWLADQNGKSFPEDALYPAFLVDRMISAIECREDGEKPFYAQLDFFGPHQPFAIPGGWGEREARIRESLELPESWLEWEAAGFPDSSDDPRVYDMYRRNWGMKNREDLADYLVANQLQYEILDHQVGRLLDYLREKDLYDSTLIIFTADHGEMNGKKGCLDKGAYLNPQVLKVPLTVKPAREQNLPAGVIHDEPCSLLDICPTVLESAGLEIPDRIDGRSLFQAVLGDGKRPEDRPVMFDVWNHVVPNPCVGRIFSHGTESFLYSYNTTSPVDEIYRIDSPVELENLIGDRELRLRALGELRKALTGDPRWEIYRCYFDLEYSGEMMIPPGDSQKFE
ncbi:MAG: sulfatase-like hydrolase/transferase [Spirochaetales bacterium]|nr:sulfatase-like hydrolase/transferase [Spirochaetales bacterium]